jgi:hypothetical protein
MRFMVIVKATEDSEAGALPSAELQTAVDQFNAELMKVDALLAGEGLHPSSSGVRVEFSGDERTIIDGPFGETRNLVAGFWLIQAQSMAEAIDCIRRGPFKEGEIEIRQLLEADDYADEFTPELRALEERLRAHASG